MSTMTRIRPLEDLRDAFGSDLLALIEGHDADADMRQRNREFVSSGKLQTQRDLWAHLRYHTGAAISPLVLPPPLQPQMVIGGVPMHSIEFDI